MSAPAPGNVPTQVAFSQERRPNYAYGTGPKESLNKEYNPSKGKYGD
jgi:hypothetical protein